MSFLCLISQNYNGVNLIRDLNEEMVEERRSDEDTQFRAVNINEF